MTTYGSSGLPDWKAITQAVARELKGEPNNHLSNRSELRWGRRGSFQLTTDGSTEGRWKDWESGQGGRGAVSLAGYLLGTDRDSALDWLRRRGYLSDHPPALVQLGIRQARYFGRAKTKLQLYLAATVANLTLVAAKVGMTGETGPAWLGQILTLTLLASALLPKSLVPNRAFRPGF